MIFVRKTTMISKSHKDYFVADVVVEVGTQAVLLLFDGYDD